jgi:hypothetical protein
LRAPIDERFGIACRECDSRMNWWSRIGRGRAFRNTRLPRVLPRGSVPRMTRGQCGSLLLHCNGLSPSTSCRSSRRIAAQCLARGLPCERFTAGLADRISCITRGRGGWLDLPRGGLSPPILCQLFLAHSLAGHVRPLHTIARHGGLSLRLCENEI